MFLIRMRMSLLGGTLIDHVYTFTASNGARSCMAALCHDRSYSIRSFYGTWNLSPQNGVNTVASHIINTIRDTALHFPQFITNTHIPSHRPTKRSFNIDTYTPPVLCPTLTNRNPSFCPPIRTTSRASPSRETSARSHTAIAKTRANRQNSGSLAFI